MDNIQILKDLFIKYTHYLIDDQNINWIITRNDKSKDIIYNLNEPENIIWLKKVIYIFIYINFIFFFFFFFFFFLKKKKKKKIE